MSTDIYRQQQVVRWNRPSQQKSHTIQSRNRFGKRLSSGVVRQAELVLRLAGVTLGDDEGDVVLLRVRAVTADVFDDGFDAQVRRQMAVTLQAVDEAFLAKLFAGAVGSLGDAVGI